MKHGDRSNMSKHIKHGEDIPKTIAVDFDGTLCEHKFPEIGAANIHLIVRLIRFRQQGGKLILWTCREGKHLAHAIAWCKEHGLEFDAVNDNVTPEYCERHNFAQHKVVAHIYIDDRNWSIEEALEKL